MGNSVEKEAKTGADFEAKLERLRGIVEKLESDVSLEEGMKLFESGLELTKECISDLNNARAEMAGLKQQLDVITQSLSGGGDE